MRAEVCHSGVCDWCHTPGDDLNYDNKCMRCELAASGVYDLLCCYPDRLFDDTVQAYCLLQRTTLFLWPFFYN